MAQVSVPSPTSDCATAAAMKLSPVASLEAHGYQALRVLKGSSSAAVLLVCRHSNPEEKFVVKTFGLGGLDAKGNRGVLQEIQLLKRLKHENIIRYVESWWNGVGPQSRRLTVVMEFAENGDLRAPVSASAQAGHQLEEVLTKRWLKQMLEGLVYIHGLNVIHRDLKAMNVFLKGRWSTCMLGDFGISAVLDNKSDGVTGCVGTPAYMAPELLWNERYSVAVDMWAIGVILYELLALRLPFKAASLLAMVYQVAFNSVEDTPMREAGYSHSIIDLVMKLLTKDPSGRPQAAAVLNDADNGLWSGFDMDAAAEKALEAFSRAEQLPRMQSPRNGIVGLDATGNSVSVDGVPVIDTFGLASTNDATAITDGVIHDLRERAGVVEAGFDPRASEPDRAGGTTDPEFIGGELCGDGSLAPAAALVMATVSDDQLWEEIRATRDETDAVPVQRFVDLLSQLSISPSCTQSTRVTVEDCTEHQDVGDNGGHDTSAAAGGDAVQEFKITIQRSSRTMLGIRATGDDPGRKVVVQAVFDWGAVQEWNKHNADRQMRVGDYIVEVNGVRGNSKKIFNKMAKSNVVKMTVRRDTSQGS